MSEHDEPTPPVVTVPESNLSAPPPPQIFSWWLRRLFACNPFYLASAALLLFGCYRVSMDATFLAKESAQLIFNFSSLQLYEMLLVLTAIFLARRKVWYDSTLLVGLETLLIFVPFILISQAALIGSGIVQAMCATGALMAILRLGGLKRFFPELELPNRLLGIGLLFLAMNVSLPLIFHHFGESKIGVNINSGPAYEMNEYAWLLILPAAFALANFLPHARETGSLLPQRRWLPTGMFSLWLAVTSVHLYCIDYIYEFNLRAELFAPAAWILAWTLYRHLPNRAAFRPVRTALTFLPGIAPLLAWGSGGTVFVALTALNIGIYAGICLFERNNQLVRHLAFASALLLFAGLPETWMLAFAPQFSRELCVNAGAGAYLVLWSLSSRNPKLALLGSITVGIAVAALLRQHTHVTHWAMQSGLAFLLLHSLRWHDAEHQGASVLRILAALLWVAESIVWTYCDHGRPWMPCVSGSVVLMIYFLTQFIPGRWNQVAVPLAASLVILSGPSQALVEGVRSIPSGLFAVIGSFVLFAAGTVAALTRRYWHHDGRA